MTHRDNKPGWQTRSPAVAAAFGLFVVAFAYLIILPVTQPLAGGVVMDGKVVSVESREVRYDDLEYTATVAYRPPDSAELLTVDTKPTSKRPSVGSTMKVSYMPDSPSTAKVVQEDQRQRFWIILGAGVFVAGSSLFTMMRRRLTEDR